MTYSIGIMDNDPCTCECVETIVTSFLRINHITDVSVWSTTFAADAITRCNSELKLFIVDMMLEGLSGSQLASQMRQLQPTLPILGITSYKPDQFRHEAAQAGILQIIDKSTLRNVLPRGIGIALKTGGIQRDCNVPQLSINEHKVLVLCAQGLTPKQIASRMGIAVDTVFSHRHRIKAKFHVHDWHEVMELSRIWHLTELLIDP